LPSSGPSNARPKRIAIFAVAISLVLTAVLGWVFFRFGSQLALAQAADSLSDTMTQLVLTVSLFIAVRPPDADHQFGHQRAEPIAALVASVMIGVVSIEVLREAIGALLGEAQPELHWALPIVFGGKALLKLVLTFVSRSGSSSVMRAIHVDSRNDVALSLLAVGGYFAARHGWPSLDAWLALPIGAWIGFSAIQLARETLPLLMGEAPSAERQHELMAVAESVEGVLRAVLLRAQHVGTHLDLDVRIEADPSCTLEDARRMGSRVEERLLEEDDVSHAMVHVAPLSEPASATEPTEEHEG
jgi:ferrous-iron efflux pump FieF